VGQCSRQIERQKWRINGAKETETQTRLGSGVESGIDKGFGMLSHGMTRH